MFIEIESLPKEPLHFRHAYVPGELRFDNDQAVLAGSVVVDFVLTHKERSLQLAGTVEASITVRCSRCLKEWAQPLAAEFDLFYSPHPRVLTPGEEIELKYDDMDVGFYDGIRFDVDLMVAERIALSLPMKAVCRGDCKGLCYRCGKDLNDGPCQCPPGETDSRMAVLLDFRRKIES